MESSSMFMELEDFGQTVDLTWWIREVLLNYPEGTTVLNELIQNADNAGATTVRLCLDRRVHLPSSIPIAMSGSVGIKNPPRHCIEQPVTHYTDVAREEFPT